MNVAQEYRKRAKEEGKVYFHYVIDMRKVVENRSETSVYATISGETAIEISEFFKKLREEGKF